MVVDEGQNLLKVEVLLLALHPQVVEGQMNHVHPGQGGKGVGRGEAAATAGASWVRAQGQGQGWDLAVGNGGRGEERSWEGTGGCGPSPILSPSQGQPLDVLWALVTHGAEE